MKLNTLKSTYFYGNKVSDYGLQNGYVDYRTLAEAFDAVICNDITKLFYNSIDNEYIDPQQVNGYIDNSDEIEELQEQIEEIEQKQIEMIKEDEEQTPEYKALQEQIDNLQEKINSLEYEQDNQQEIFQYFIISDYGAEILQTWTDEIVYYIDYLDIYIWGVTHYGTSWDYVLTNIKIEKDVDENE